MKKPPKNTAWISSDPCEVHQGHPMQLIASRARGIPCPECAAYGITPDEETAELHLCAGPALIARLALEAVIWIGSEGVPNREDYGAESIPDESADLYAYLERRHIPHGDTFVWRLLEGDPTLAGT